MRDSFILTAQKVSIDGAILYAFTADQQVRRTSVPADYTVFCGWQEHRETGALISIFQGHFHCPRVNSPRRYQFNYLPQLHDNNTRKQEARGIDAK